MRLIDQLGKSDVPYDLVAISTGYGEPERKYNVYIHSKLFNDKVVVFAQYSSEDKLHKAIQLLRDVYAGLPIIMQNVEVDEQVVEKLKNTNTFLVRIDSQPSRIEYIHNGYFRFPKDEDVGGLISNVKT